MDVQLSQSLSPLQVDHPPSPPLYPLSLPDIDEELLQYQSLLSNSNATTTILRGNYLNILIH